MFKHKDGDFRTTGGKTRADSPETGQYVVDAFMAYEKMKGNSRSALSYAVNIAHRCFKNIETVSLTIDKDGFIITVNSQSFRINDRDSKNRVYEALATTVSDVYQSAGNIVFKGTEIIGIDDKPVQPLRDIPAYIKAWELATINAEPVDAEPVDAEPV